jgi:prepilin-type N-terminal cleavage/methylation domain-containing protein
MKSRRKGFTLIELMVALGIAVVMFTLLFIPMLSAMNTLNQAHARNEIQRNEQTILSKIRAELSQAIGVFSNDAPRTTITVPAPGAPLIVGGFTYSTIQVADTSGFAPGDPVILVQRNASGVIQYQENARILDISEPTNIPGVCAPTDQYFPNLPPSASLCPPLNTMIVGISSMTNNKELQRTYTAGSDVIGPFPYVDSANHGTLAVQNRVGLTSRLDFVLPRNLTAGISPGLPLEPETFPLIVGMNTLNVPVMVTYYVRKREPLDQSGQPRPYDPIDNPLLLYRTQYVPRLGPGATLDEMLNNGCWRIDSINLDDARGNANDYGCNPFANPPDDRNKGPMISPAVVMGTAHNTLVPLTEVDLVGRCVDGSDPTDPTNPDCSLNGSKLVTDTNFTVHREGGRTRVTINLTLGRFDRGKSKFHKLQMQTDVDVANAHRQ